MIHLKTYSASVCVFVFLLLCSMFVVVAEEFGEIVDENGDPIEPAKTTEYGG